MRQLERLYSVWLKIMALPDLVDNCLTFAMLFGHRPITPLRSSRMPGLQRDIDNFLDLVCRELRFASAACIHFIKTVQSITTEALPPQSNRFKIDLYTLGDIFMLLTFLWRQYYPTALSNLLHCGVLLGLTQRSNSYWSNSLMVTFIFRLDMN